MSTTSPHPASAHHALHGLFRTRVAGRARTATAVVRIITGLLFALSAIPKFALHDIELAEFVRYGFPASSPIVYLVGLLELGGGLLLLLGLGTRIAAAGLAVNMAGAILTAGIRVGGPIHLGVAPTLLIATLYLIWAGAGTAALDRRLDARFSSRSVAATSPS